MASKEDERKKFFSQNPVIRAMDKSRGKKVSSVPMGPAAPKAKKEKPALPKKDIKPIIDAAQKEMNVSLNKGEKKKTEEILTSAPKLENSVEKAEQGKGGVADNFSAALMHFVPLVAGSALFGLEAGVAAQEGTLKAAEMQRKAGLEERKVIAEERRAGPAEMTDFQRESLQLRKEALDLEKGAEKRRTEGLELNRDKFGFSKQQASQLSGKQAEKLEDILKVEASVDRIDELRASVATGPLAGRIQTFGQWADLAPESFTKMKSQTTATLADYVKSISGAQVSVEEAKRLQAIIPSVNDAPDVFKAKLEEFTSIVQRNKKAFAESIRTGQPLKAGTVAGLDKAESRFLTRQEPSKGAPPTQVGKRERAIALMRKAGKSDEEIAQALQQAGY